jgi:hypothetical protein
MYAAIVFMSILSEGTKRFNRNFPCLAIKKSHVVAASARRFLADGCYIRNQARRGPAQETSGNDVDGVSFIYPRCRLICLL